MLELRDRGLKMEKIGEQGRMALAALSGLLGNSLPEGLRVPDSMVFRIQGRDKSPAELADIFGGSAEREVVFFVHGVMADDACWRFSSFNMTRAWEEQFGVFPVHLAYNSGLHISDNGLAFASLLEEFHRCLPPGPRKWHIVAHSMGGLVTRSALFQAERNGMSFTGCVDKVFLLATPNRGAPLEKAVVAALLALQAATYLPFRYTGLGLRKLLAMIPIGDQGATLAPAGWTADFFIRQMPTFYLKLAAGILNLRSDGITDLCHGYMLQEEWQRPKSWGGLRPNKAPVPPLRSARYFAVAGSLSKKEAAAPSLYRTDGMVSTASAANTGEGDELHLVENGRYHELAGIPHFMMPFSRETYEVLAGWFAEGQRGS